MLDINALLTIPYVEYGRETSGADCWGLVRIVREQLRGNVLPSFGGIGAANRREMTDVANGFCAEFAERAEPQPGAIAFVWHGRLCVHVGIVIEAEGALAVLETTRASGVRWVRLREYNLWHPRVTYHDND